MQLTSESAAWLPLVDVCEGDDAFVILVDVPSLTPSDLKLSRVGPVTTLKGGRAPPYAEVRIRCEVFSLKGGRAPPYAEVRIRCEVFSLMGGGVPPYAEVRGLHSALGVPRDTCL